MTEYQDDFSIPEYAYNYICQEITKPNQTQIKTEEENLNFFGNVLENEAFRDKFLHHGKITEREILELSNEKLTDEQLLSKVDELINHAFDEFLDRTFNQDIQSQVEQFEKNMKSLHNKLCFCADFNNPGLRNNPKFNQKLNEIHSYKPKKIANLENKTFQEQMHYFTDKVKEIKVNDVLRRSTKEEINFYDTQVLTKLLMDPKATNGVLPPKSNSYTQKTIEELNRYGYKAEILKDGSLNYTKSRMYYPQQIGKVQTEVSTIQKTEATHIVKSNIHQHKEIKGHEK